MDKIAVIVTSATGAISLKAELYSSGVIHYEDYSFSHIAAEVSQGKKIHKYIEPIVVKEEVKTASPVQTESPKKSKRKG